MKRPAVFFDRDNTLIVSNGFVGDPAQVKLMNVRDAAVALRKCNNALRHGRPELAPSAR